MSLKTVATAVRKINEFVAQMFAFEGMYERKAVYVRHRLPH